MKLFLFGIETKKNSTMNVTQSKELIKDYIELSDFNEKNRPLLEATIKEDESSVVDIVNFLEPRLTDQINLVLEPRIPIGHEYLFQNMREKYLTRRGLIRLSLPVRKS